MEKYPVKIRVYDASHGLAKKLAEQFDFKEIEAIWHTSVEVYGKEYYFQGGIVFSEPGTTPFGTPLKMHDMGHTEISEEVFNEYLKSISSMFTAQTYNLLKHNCNNFTDNLTIFLVGQNVPKYILDLPDLVMKSGFFVNFLQEMDKDRR